MGKGFTRSSELRISSVVQRVEREPLNPPPRRECLRTQASRVWFGKLDGALSQGGSATMSIWAGDPLADTGDNITVHDWFLGSGESIDSGKKIKAEFYCGKWYATTGEC